MIILFPLLTKKDKEKFIEFYNYRITEEKVYTIKQALDKLDKNFDENVKIPKTSISFIIYMVYRSIKDKKRMGKTIDAIKNFSTNYKSNEEYKSYIKQETSLSGSINKRFEF